MISTARFYTLYFFAVVIVSEVQESWVKTLITILAIPLVAAGMALMEENRKK